MSQKKSSLVAGNRPGEKFLLSTRPHTSNEYDNTKYVLKKHTQTRKFGLANLFALIYVFFPFKQ